MDEFVEYEEWLADAGAIEPVFVGKRLRWRSTLPPLPPKEPEVDWEAYEDLMSLY